MSVSSSLYLFIEGQCDTRFFSWYFINTSIKPIEYSHMKKTDIKGVVNALSQNEKPYIFLKDADGKTEEERYADIIERYPFIDKSRCF